MYCINFYRVLRLNHQIGLDLQGSKYSPLALFRVVKKIVCDVIYLTAIVAISASACDGGGYRYNNKTLLYTCNY